MMTCLLWCVLSLTTYQAHFSDAQPLHRHRMLRARLADLCGDFLKFSSSETNHLVVRPRGSYFLTQNLFSKSIHSNYRHLHRVSLYYIYIVYTSGSQPGCRGTLGCHLQYPGVPRANAFFNILLKVHFQTVIKPWSKIVWVRHWVPQNIILFCRVPQA